MGTYGGYNGTYYIAEEMRDEFSKKMERILNLGGMMELEQIKIYGKEIYLLNPVTIKKGEKINFQYNYFEDDVWENVTYDEKEAHLSTGKIGWAEFNDVITAAHMLYEVCDPTIGYAYEDGNPISTTQVARWLNRILGTDYNMEKRFRLWEMAEAYIMQHVSDDYEREKNLTEKSCRYLIPLELCHVAGGTDLADLLYIANGTESLQESNIDSNTYPADILECKNALIDYFASSGRTDLEELFEFLKQTKDDRKNWNRPYMSRIAELSLRLPARVILYLTAEIRELSFWEMWKNHKENLYQDEQMKKYAPDTIEALRNTIRKMPIEPVSTCSYLKQDDSIFFYRTPEELKKEPKYSITDEDRLYWWDDTDEVTISKETHEWLTSLADRHKEWKDKVEINHEPGYAIRDFFQILVRVNDQYKRIFPFKEMFYEFLDNSKQIDYLAAVRLLEEIAEEEQNRKYIEHLKKTETGTWSMASRKVTFNPGRLRIKRYLGVMANQRLRMRYFGF